MKAEVCSQKPFTGWMILQVDALNEKDQQQEN